MAGHEGESALFERSSCRGHRFRPGDMEPACSGTPGAKHAGSLVSLKGETAVEKQAH